MLSCVNILFLIKLKKYLFTNILFNFHKISFSLFSYLDKMSRQRNRPCADGYIKLAAESVAINPLESKKN